MLHAQVERAVSVGGMLAQHFLHCGRGMTVGGKLVLHLHRMLCQPLYLPFPFPAQHLAHAAQHGSYDAFKQIVPAHKEIRCLRCQSQSQQLLPQRLVRFAPLRKLPLQTAHLGVHQVPEMLQCLFGMIIVELVELHHMVKVEHGKLLVSAITIAPDVPDKKRPDDFAVALQEEFKIEHAAVVQCNHDTHIVQCRGVTLKILYGIGIGMEHIRIAAHLCRQGGYALHQVVIIGIHASYHATPQPVSQFVGQSYFLPFAQAAVGRQHHLKEIPVRFERPEQVAPEKHIVVTLHISHNAFAALFAAQTVHGLYIVRIQVLA